MTETELQNAEDRFRARISSLRNDVARCYWWPINALNPPQLAPFPAAMYCFSTLDFFSSFWAGWNDGSSKSTNPSKPATKANQTVRMTDFLVHFLHYGKKEAYLAICLWRHKTMHTGEPRRLKNENKPGEFYDWCIGPGGIPHMTIQDVSGVWVLGFDCQKFADDLNEGVFGKAGYVQALRGDPGLQTKYGTFDKELADSTIDFKPVGL
jgi:hypothetical protein